MAKRKLMFLLGSILIVSLVAAYINSNWSKDVTSTTPEENTPEEPTTEEPTTEEPATEEPTTEEPTTEEPTTEEPTTEEPATEEPTTEEPTTEEPTTEEPPTEEPPTEEPPTEEPPTSDPSDITIDEALGNNEDDHEDEEDYIWDSSDVITITLNFDSISVDDENGTTIDETTVTITSAGTYNISGILEDGQIVVDTNDEEVVRLILNGVNISSTTNAPIYVEDAAKTVIVLADNTENYLTDNVNNEDNGTLLSRDDLTIYGNGSLTVSGNANDAIRSNDGLIIKSGNITVTSVDDGIRGKNYLVINGGNITVNSVGDGLKSDNAEEVSRGYISIEDGTIDITSTNGDAITAQTDLLVTGGTFTLTSGGGSAVPPDDISTKGLKAVVCIVIDDGNFTINSSDDAIHSDHLILINNGTYHIASGDDGIHADTSLEINGGTFVISQSYEGLESNMKITINNGHFEIYASDDGINVAEGNGDGGWGGWGGGGFGPPGEYYIFINGGFIYIESDCDGLDSDGYIEMSGGVLIINGPVPGSFPNGVVDYGMGSFNLTGGTLVGVGSSDMAQAPSPISTQYSVLVNFRFPQFANRLVNIQTASGETVLTFKPTKAYQSIVFSSPELTTGSYDLYLGGSSTGTLSYGIYENGTYTPGTKYTNFTISEVVTIIGGTPFLGWQQPSVADGDIHLLFYCATETGYKKTVSLEPISREQKESKR